MMPQFPLVRGVPVCRECRYGVLPRHIDAHLEEKHEFDRDERARIWCQNSGDGSVVEDEDELDLGDDIPVPFPQLLTPKTNAMACQPLNGGVCADRFICTSVAKMKARCYHRHGWKSSLKRGQRISNGRGSIAAVRPWRDGVPCQYFWKRGKAGRYFEVQAGLPSTASSHATSSRSMLGSLGTKIQQMDHNIKARERARIDAGDDAV